MGQFCSISQSTNMFIRSAILASALMAMASAQSDTPFLKTAMDVFARATTNSEVLSLNLSGLIILLVLKVAVVAFSLMSGGASARSAASSYSEADLTGGMCFILYTSGDEDKLNCVARAACESTENAADFLTLPSSGTRCTTSSRLCPSMRSTTRSLTSWRLPTILASLVANAQSLDGN